MPKYPHSRKGTGRKRKENWDRTYKKRRGRIGKQSRKGKKEEKWRTKRGNEIGTKKKRHETEMVKKEKQRSARKMRSNETGGKDKVAKK